VCITFITNISAEPINFPLPVFSLNLLVLHRKKMTPSGRCHGKEALGRLS